MNAQKLKVVSQAAELLKQGISGAIEQGVEFEILLALYQKLAILCFDHEQYIAVYPVLCDLIYSGQARENGRDDDANMVNSVEPRFASDVTLLLVLAQIEYKLGNSQACNHLCDMIISQSPQHMQALEMKGDICKHFCQIDQAFYYYSKAIESSQSFSSQARGGGGVSSALSNMGDLYKMQGKMREAIRHYERALTREAQASAKPAHHSETQAGQKLTGSTNVTSEQSSISTVYAETFMKLFNTKMACCDWTNYFEFTEHLKEIVLK